MHKIEKRITLNVPVEKVWEYLEDAARLPEIWPSLLEVKDMQPSPRGGEDFRWVYKMAGLCFEGSSEVLEFAKPHHIVITTKGEIEGTITLHLRPMGARTEVTTTTEYAIPMPLLNRMAELFIVKSNEHEAEAFLANLKLLMEIRLNEPATMPT